MRERIWFVLCLRASPTALKDTFTIFKEIGVPLQQIRLGGGGARSPLWRQIQADVYGHEIEILEAEEGAGLRGCDPGGSRSEVMGKRGPGLRCGGSRGKAGFAGRGEFHADAKRL